MIFATLIGKLEPGKNNVLLEKRIMELFRIENAYTVNQARVGIYLAIRAVISKQKNEIILSPYTIFDVVNMVICAGGKPVFVDIEKETCNIDPKKIGNKINDNTAAVMATHLHGVPCDMKLISKICKKNQIYLIEDSAQAFGVPYEDKFLGTVGDIGIYSFGLFKTVNSFFGGLVVCHDKALMERMKSFTKNFGTNPKTKILKRIIQSVIFDIAATPIVFKLFTFWIFRYGYLSGNPYLNKLTRSENNPVLKTEFPEEYKNLMSNVQASIALKQLDQVQNKMKIRQNIASVYFEGLKSNKNISMPPDSPQNGNGCLQYPIQVENRHDFLVYLARKGRDCAPQHIRNCADLDMYKEYYKDCPVARKTAKSVIILPTYIQYGLKEAYKNVNILSSFGSNAK